MKKLMIAMAVVAMVGAANAAASYHYDSFAYVNPYSAKDATPGEGHSSWYSFYGMIQETAQDLLGVSKTVTYQDVANWLGKNFAANKDEVIQESQKLTYDEFYSITKQYRYYDNFRSAFSECHDYIGVAFFDNGADVAYNVLSANVDGTYFDFDDNIASASTGWLSVEVPEPTSGLLMLLGMVGLALRHRRA